MVRNNKRRRSVVLSQTSPSSEPPDSHPEIDNNASEEEEHVEEQPEADDTQGAADLGSALDIPLEMAQEVWEALREEFYEQVEQLPLSLHRSFAIIGEQDKEAEACQAELLPTIRSYVKLRQALRANASSSAAADSDTQSPQGLVLPPAASDSDTRAEESRPAAAGQTTGQQRMNTSPESETEPLKLNGSSLLPHKEEDHDITMEDVSLQRSQHDDGTSGSRPLASTQSTHVVSSSRDTPSSVSLDKPSQSASARTHGLRETDATVPKSVPFPPRPKPKTTRELLTRISFLMGELLRASEEKVGLATAAYDSVDRHVRALDTAIKEHEAATAFGSHESTRPVGMAVPEDNDPTLSELVDEDDEEPQLGMIGPGAGVMGRPMHRSRRIKKRDRRDHRKHVMAERPTVRLNAPPPPYNVGALAPPTQNDMPIDPHEPRYCYCHQVSYGEMIACDNPDCSREWFHLGCAGLAAPPKGKVKWYCRDCEEALGRNRRRRVR